MSSALRADDLVSARVVALFPRVEHWFRIVDTLRFAVDADGARAPVFQSLTHPRVRHADGAGHSLAPRFASHFDGTQRVAAAEDPELYVDLTPVDGAHAPVRVERGLVVYADAFRSTDIIFKATPTHVDEYLLLRDRRAPLRFRYRTRVGSHVAMLVQAGNAIEVRDAQGAARLRASQPFAMDRSGKRVDGTIRLDGDDIVVDINVRGLRWPILVDPDWMSTGDMAFGRFYHAQNELPNERVLVTGGCSASVCSGDLTIPACRSVVASSELLDLDTRTFSRAADTTPRYFHSAVSLATGDVLLAGGCTSPECSVTQTTERYGAGDGVFSSGPDLAEARAGIASIRLSSGRVLLAGGATMTSASNRVEIYDPISRLISTASPMNVARGRATVTELADGRILVAGGCTTIACDTVVADAEVFDPTLDTWEHVASMSVPRAGHFASALTDGRVLIGGGCSTPHCTDGPHMTTEFFVVAESRFVPGPDLHAPRFGAQSVVLPDLSVMVSQGCDSPSHCDLSNELFTPSTGSFAPISNAVTSRAFHSLLLHTRRHVVIANGGCQPATCSWWVETYDVASLHPPIDAGVADAGSDADTDAGAAIDAGYVDAALADSAIPDAGPVHVLEPHPHRALPPPSGCDCRVAHSARRWPTAWLVFTGMAAALAMARRKRRR
ncbi:MAG: hypothetical protein IPK60_01570 [Sandaracinaceae bacterium]|nr:hypothetical protein [Sandaracinaceae bacterium]